MTLGKKIEYIIFILFVFFQNFALINTSSFGISASVCFFALISLLDIKKYYRIFKKKFLLLLLIIFVFLAITSLINGSVLVSQILKVLMIIWLIYISNIYVKEVFSSKENKSYFCRAYINILMLLLLYGFYEVFAEQLHLPLFLNVFSNNLSYGSHTLYDYFHGWVNSARLYSVFFEPSVFSIFLVFNFFFIKEIYDIPKIKKFFVYFLILFNLFFTYSRTGYITFIYMCIIYIYYEKMKKNNNFINFIVLMLPFFTLYMMYAIGLAMYNDKSSLMRTYSGIYYLNESFSSIKYVLFGHGCGSIVSATITEKYIANCANNGYVDILYQYGLVAMFFYYKFLKNIIERVCYKKYLIVGTLGTLCCFASYYLVESIVILLVIIYNYVISIEKQVK